MAAASGPTSPPTARVRFLYNPRPTRAAARALTRPGQAEAFRAMSPPVITNVKGRQLLDSRGNPTVEAEVTTYKGTFRAIVPSGASTGVYEAVELRDGEGAFLGKGVNKAVENINTVIAPALQGLNPVNQGEIDDLMKELDGTEDKGKLGANAILAVSMAVCKAGAEEKRVPLYQHIADLAGNRQLVLPVPAFNIINGGSHAGNALAMQEFMVLPTGADTFSEAMRMGAECYHHLKKVIKEKYGPDACNVGDEGGFAPNILSNSEGLELVVEAIEKAGYTGKIKIGMDVAASEFFDKEGNEGAGAYDLNWKAKENDGSGQKTGEEMVAVYEEFCANYPVISIEDPFDQDDFENTAALTAKGICQVVGDDLLVTNPARIASAIKGEACNALLLKVNQIGTVTESIEAVRMAKKAGWGVMASHRSGETEDTFIADLAVGLSTGQIKSGAPCRSERLAKYNQIMRIEEELGGRAVYAGEGYAHVAWE